MDCIFHKMNAITLYPLYAVGYYVIWATELYQCVNIKYKQKAAINNYLRTSLLCATIGECL